MFNYRVSVKPVETPNTTASYPFVATASLIIEDLLEIRGFKIIDGQRGLFVSPPARQYDRDGQRAFYNLVFWHEDREDGTWRGRYEGEVYKAMIDEYLRLSRNTSRSSAARAQRRINAEASGDPVDEEKLW